jgi:ribosome assembly protein SQT1
MTVVWAIPTLSGIATLANAVYSSSELAHQIKSSGAKFLFTCVPLLQTALEAAKQAGISHKHVYLLDVPSHVGELDALLGHFKTVDALIYEGKSLSSLPKLVREKGQGAWQVALLSYSSGTSGPPVSTVEVLVGTANEYMF